MKKYSLISLSSYLFRTIILSQLFDFAGISILVDLIVPGITFLMVGIIYPPGKNPPLGAFMYLVMYILNFTIGNIILGTWFSVVTIIAIFLYFFIIGVYYYIFGKLIDNG
ncbi:MAG: hypothetical protein CVU94_01945 [Firmicutes bacterium HGW-Firmicutes-19]|nr:MAG: hypothetical protein CVU94_01945 [Firmicutes bacterium HGW-Firmicutes-19]